jgi:predicted nucleotidyltransferase component of viral defense system
MKLHLDVKLFKNYIALASQEEKIDEGIILKDYFVVLALKELYKNQKDLIFIGGTSLSKCYQMIERFSEDIDIVSTAKSRKAKQKKAHEAIENLVNTWPWKTESSNPIHSDFKEVYLYYDTEHQSELDQRVKLELITFTDPFPVIEKEITPIIYKYLEENEKIKFEIYKVKVLTQEPFRTFVEKITLEKELYKEFLEKIASDESQEKRARDFYDIHKIWQFYHKNMPITQGDFIGMLDSRIEYRPNRTIISIGSYNNYPLLDMFLKRNIRKQLEEVDKKKLSIRDLNCDDIETSLKEIDKFFMNLLR